MKQRLHQCKGLPMYLHDAMTKKSKPLNATTARARVSPKRRAGRKTSAPKPSSKRTTKKLLPPKQGFDAMKWCGVLPELAGDPLAIQRQMRDEW
jgi:hypothetical protein